MLPLCRHTLEYPQICKFLDLHYLQKGKDIGNWFNAVYL